MLIVALVLAVIGLAALVTAVVTSNELIAWACIAASVVGVLLLIVDALRERSRGAEETPAAADDSEEEDAEDYPEEAPTAQDDVAESDAETTVAEQPDEVADEAADEDSNSR